MLRNARNLKNSAKFPATTHCCSMVKSAHLEDSLTEIFRLEASPVEGQSLSQKDQKGKK